MLAKQRIKVGSGGEKMAKLWCLLKDERKRREEDEVRAGWIYLGGSRCPDVTKPEHLD